MRNTAAATSSGITAATMKLLVDRASQRVLFAEAGKDVVDVLFGVLATPVGGLVSLLHADAAAADDTLGSVVNVYASAERMDAAYMQGAEARDALLVNDTLPAGPSLRLAPIPVPAAGSRPTAALPPRLEPFYPYWMHRPPAAPQVPPVRYPPQPPAAAPAPPQRPADRRVDLLPLIDDDGEIDGLLPPTLYRCHACYALGSTMGSKGFVQGVATYTVMDDLTVTPGSNMSTVALLGSIGVRDLGAVEEKTVTVGRKECLEIIKVSLRSKTVLTDVFMGKTKKRARTAAGDNDDENAASEQV